jgi:hypothetical protein
MPIRYETDDARRRVVVRMQGPFALADFLAVIERQRGDNASAYGVLYDLRGMTGEPSIADLRQSMSQIGLRGPIAILATDPAINARACTSLHARGARTLNADFWGLSRVGQGRAVADCQAERVTDEERSTAFQAPGRTPRPVSVAAWRTPVDHLEGQPAPSPCCHRAPYGFARRPD